LAPLVVVVVGMLLKMLDLMLAVAEKASLLLDLVVEVENMQAAA